MGNSGSSSPGNSAASGALEGPEAAESGSGGGGTGHWVLLVMILMLVCLLMRLSGLMVMPIFGDEAIYLRWAQLIRGEGFTAGSEGAGVMHPWVSLADPKPPLHFWLLALFYKWSSNPLLVLRTLSVAAGVASIPLIYAAGRELGWLVRNRAHPGGTPIFVTGRVLGLLAALMVIFCPFLSFYHRLGTADALFAAESIAIAWLALRWGRVGTDPLAVRGWGAWLTAVALGAVIGAALMTRQGLSYTMAMMPAVAWVLHWHRRREARGRGGVATGQRRATVLVALMQLAMAAVLAAILWVPYLTAELAPRALEMKRDTLQDPEATLQTADLMDEVKRRILYQGKFTERSDPLAIAKRNLLLTFVPGNNERGVMDYGWFYYYLTPGVYLACLGGLVYLGMRGQWRLLVLLVAWIVLSMGPVLLFANVIFSRYVLAGVPPFLVAGAFVVGDVLGVLFTRYAQRPAIPWVAAGLVFFALLFVPLVEMGKQASRWWEQRLTARDNYQYVSGWPAGRATEKAIVELLKLSMNGPIVVITDNGWGTPADAVWVYLSDRPNILLYYTDRERILDPVAEPSGGRYWLRPNKFLYPPYEKVGLPRNVPVLYVTKEQANPVIDHLRVQNPTIEPWETFVGVVNPRTGRGDPEGSVTIFQLPTP